MPAVVALDVAAAAAIQVGTGYLVHRLPDRLLEGEGWLFRQRGFEDGGRLYVRALAIKRWKKLLPEGGDVFAGGFDKAVLAALSDEYLSAYVRETRRAELGHWLAASLAPVVFVWNPCYLAVALQVCFGVANGPCIVSQRYNRIRLQRVLDRRAGRQRKMAER